jgi:hypothetical protein
MRKVAFIAMWRNGVVMAIRDIPATGIVAMAMDIVATGIVATMAILIMVGTTEEGTTTNITGLITEAITDTHMVATTAGIIESSGLASIKDGRRRQAEARGSRGASNLSPLILSFNTNVALAYIHCM